MIDSSDGQDMLGGALSDTKKQYHMDQFSNLSNDIRLNIYLTWAKY